MTTHSSAPWRTLPDQPNLEQLKKQAKDLLRNYRAGEADAVAEVQRAQRSPAADITLADAQRILARAYGFASWARLRQKVEGITVAAFCAAAARGDVEKLKALHRHNPQLIRMEMADSDERIALHYAVLNRQAEAVRFLMAAGSDARKGVYPNRDATTPLIIATDRGYDEIVRIIEEAEQHRRADASCPNATVSLEQDAINAAIRAGRTDEAIALLSADETLIKACDRDGASPLHVAGEMGDVKLVEWLLARRAGVSRTDLKGRTPLDRAVFGVISNKPGTLDRFKRIGPRLRAAGSPLTLAAAIALGEGERVVQLHREDPKAFAPGALVPGPLGIAVRHRRHDMIRLLLDLGQDPDERRRVEGLEDEQYSAGDPLWHAARDNDYEAAVMLLDRGADPNAMLYASGTPTNVASNPRMQKLLMERGGKLMSTSVGGHHHVALARRLLDGLDLQTILPDTHPGPTLAEQLLWGAACSGNPETVCMALARIDWPPEDRRWFYMAVQPLRIHMHGPGFWAERDLPRGYVECFRLIIARVDPNLRGRRGETFLHRVASDGITWGHEVMLPAERIAFAGILLEAGARFDVREELLQSTPLAWAVRWGRAELVDLLLARGCPAREPDAEPWAQPMAWAERYQRSVIAERLRAAGG